MPPEQLPTKLAPGPICLCCPALRLPLAAADARQVVELQAKAQAGKLQTVAGRTVSEQFEGALVRCDGQLAYLVIGGIARLVADEAVSLAEPGGKLPDEGKGVNE